MGYYINPITSKTTRDKAGIIIGAAGNTISRQDFLNHKPGQDDYVGVALFDNGAFIAAGIAHTTDERDYFAEIRDGRKIDFVLVPIKVIERLDPSTGEAIRKMFPLVKA